MVSICDMSKFITLCILLLVFHIEFESCYGSKKVYKNIKKLPKSEVDVKAYVFPCTIYEEQLLNSSLTPNRKHLRNCIRKLIIRMTVNYGGQYCSKSDGFIPIYHVVDGISGRKKRLLHPIMVRIKRERMYQLYDLQLVKSVNAEAGEDVLQYENTANFTGCDTSSSRPTCGYSFYKNKIIQFSEGFCCSCDQSVNDQRQPCDGRPGERKYPPDMKLTVGRPRSNRTSRGLAAAKKENELSGNLSDNERQNMLFDKNQAQLNAENKLPEIIEYLKQENILNQKVDDDYRFRREKDLPNDLPDPYQGITVRSFKFENSIAPIDGNRSLPEKISNIEILINEQKQENNRGVNCISSIKSNNSISPENMKLIIKNRIRVNENNEKVIKTPVTIQQSFPTIEYSTKSPCKVRSIFGKRSGTNNSPEKSCKHDNKTFALKLLSGNSELEINIATVTTPIYISSNRAGSSYFNISSKMCKTTKLTTKSNFKSAIKSFFSKSSNESSSNRREQKETTKPVKCSLNKKNDSLGSIEKLVYEMIPIMNEANSRSDSGRKNLEVIFKGLENTTQSVYIQFINVSKSKGNLTPLEATSQKNNLKTNQNSSYLYFQSINSMISDNLKLRSGDNDKKFTNNIIEPRNLGAYLPVEPNKKIEKREACEKQIRGGQRCSVNESSVPCYADPETYFESAHCLRFSDLWYNVHRLVNPKIENAITVKIYAKHKRSPKKACWEHLTKHVPGRVGTVNEVLTDDQGNVAIAYSSDDNVAYSLDCSSDYLLVPQPIPRQCKSAELKSLSCGGPGEYLVLKENEISFSGDECDRAGVSFTAFARQQQRCQHEAGACLRNQPLHFWREDRKAEAEGNRGQYFLKNFVTVTDQVILLNRTSNQVVLRAPYYERYQSQVVAELNADHIDIIADRSEGQVTEVYVDATSERTVLKAVITNMGIAVDLFSVDLVNCTRPIGPYEFDKPGKKEIPPQHRTTFTATIARPLSIKQTECQLIVYGVDQEVVASRRVLFVRGERCVCVWHCRCVCADYPQPGLLCLPLSLMDFHRAGFPGHLPGPVMGTSCSTLFVVLQALLLFFLILLLFGLIKAVLGVCFPRVGIWGLWCVVPEEVRCMPCYLEPELASRPVVVDCNGHPVHPYSYRRTVHFLPFCAEFVINVLFFILFARHHVCRCLIRMSGSRGQHGYSRYYQRKRPWSPFCRPDSPCGGASPRSPRSPCGSVCSGARWPRMYAGGEEKDPQTLADEKRAEKFVQKLTSLYYVYRNMKRPVGGVKCVPGVPYCVRGYFLQADNGVYEFHPPSPLQQLKAMDRTPLDHPVVLDPTPFRVVYPNAVEAMMAGEVSHVPHGIILNE